MMNSLLPVQHAAIMAGGASRRMGQTKALLSIKGEPLIARVAQTVRGVLPELFVVTSAPEIAAAANAPHISDSYAGKGPLAGIHAALEYANAPVFCCACDMPYLNAEFIRYQCSRLHGYQAVVPRIGNRLEPLHAVYAPVCLPVIAAALQRDDTAVKNIFAALRVLVIEEELARRFDTTLRMFDNWNTPQDIKL